MPQIEKPDDLQSIANLIRLRMHDNRQKEDGGKFDWELGALIERVLYLTKSLPFTDKSMKMSRLSVNGSLEKCRLRTKWSKIAVCP